MLFIIIPHHLENLFSEPGSISIPGDGDGRKEMNG